MMKNHARAEAVLSKAMMRVIELEADRVVKEMRKEKKKPINPIAKFFGTSK